MSRSQSQHPTRDSVLPSSSSSCGFRALSRIALVAILLSVMSGCAYFNTFYHAKQFYGQGEKTRETERGQLGASSASSNYYKQCIQKCEKVVQKYKGSKWEDDAWLLMAESHYWRGDYLSAQDALSSLLAMKKTDLRDQGLFWQGRTALAQENYREAQGVWQSLLKEYPKFKKREEVEYYLAVATLESDDAAGAIQAYQALLQRYPKGEHAALARLDLGGLLVEEKRYEEAGKVFAFVAQKGKLEEDRIQAKMSLGDVYEKQGRHQDALKLYTDLEVSLDASARKNRMSWEDRQQLELVEQQRLDQALADSLQRATLEAQMGGDPMAGVDATGLDPNDPNAGLNPVLPRTNTTPATKQATNVIRRDANDPRQKDLAQVLIREGCVLANLEKTDEALSAFQQVVAEYPQTPYAAEAQYRIGYTYEVHLEQFDRAQLAYDAVERQGNSSFRDDAVRRSKNLVALKTLMATAAKDSLSLATSAAAESRFMRAELYLFQQENVERAVEEYTSIEKEFDGTEHAAKAGLALAWIAENSHGDSAAAAAKYTEVAEKYPDTEYGRRAHATVYGPEPEPEPFDFAGPSLDELITPENQQAAWRQAGGDSTEPGAEATGTLAGVNTTAPGGNAAEQATSSGVVPGTEIAGTQGGGALIGANAPPDSLLMAGSSPPDTNASMSIPPTTTAGGPSVAANAPPDNGNESSVDPAAAPNLSAAGSSGPVATASGVSGTGTPGPGPAGGAAGAAAAAGASLGDMVKSTRGQTGDAPSGAALPVGALPDSVPVPVDSTSVSPLPGGLYLDPLAVPAAGPSPVTPPRKPRPRDVPVPQEKTSEPSGKDSKSTQSSGKNSSKKDKPGSTGKETKKGAAPDSTSGTGQR